MPEKMQAEPPFLSLQSWLRERAEEAPLLQSLRFMGGRSERGLAVFYSLLCCSALVSLSAPVSERVVSHLMANFHFRPRSWAAWIALQPVPKMYSFANTCWIGTAPLLEQEPAFQSELRFSRESFWVNHYPARKARFDGFRETLGPSADHFIYVRSVYFGYTETTGFHVRAEPGHCVFELREGVK